MGKILPSKVEKNIKSLIFQRADEFGYASRSRRDNSQFMDELVEDPEIGGYLKNIILAKEFEHILKTLY